VIPIRRLTALIIPLLLPVLGACSPEAELPTVVVRSGPLARVQVESGEVSAVRSQQVRPPLEWSSDLIVTAMLPEGATVARGDAIIHLDPSGLDRQIDEVEARLASLATQRDGVVARQESERQALRNAVAMARLSREQAELQIEKLEFESDTRRQEARLRLNRALVSLDEAQVKLAAQAVLDSLELAKTDLEIASARLERQQLQDRRAAMVIRAPQDGMVVYLEQRDREGRRTKPRVGDAVQPWRPVVEIPDLSAMQVEFFVHEVDRHRVRVGLPVRAWLEAYPDVVLTGEIVEIARLATSTDGDEGTVRGFACRAELAGSDPRLRPGMTAVVEIDLGMRPDVVQVPLGAVFERDGASVVYPRATWPEPRPVKLGPRTPLLAAALDGVAAGERLVTAAPTPEGEP